MPVQGPPELVTVDDVRDRVNADDDSPSGPVTKALQQCLAVAMVKIAAHTADYDADALTDLSVPQIPQVVKTQAILAVAVELYNQQDAPNGILSQQYAGDDGLQTSAIHISADPLRPAYPLLGQWVSPVTFA